MPFFPAMPRTLVYSALLIAGIAALAKHLVSPAGQGIVSAAVVSGWIMALVTCIYAVAALPRVIAAKTRGERQIASEIRRALPPDALLWVNESEYYPFWYYLEPRVAYFSDLSQVPANAGYLLLPGKSSGRPGAVVLLRRAPDGWSDFAIFKTHAAAAD
jgi:hypothetical protein